MERTNSDDRPVVKFCVDRIVDGKPYPNLAVHEARPYTPEWRQFSVKWPYSEPVHFFEYLDQESIPYQLVQWSTSDRSTLYPVSISFFDFSIDWFEILPQMIREKLRSKSLTLWFFYSEGDNPQRIKDHLYNQFSGHGVDTQLIQFTSANSSAGEISGFHHFVDDECLYRLRNTDVGIEFHTNQRSKKFTALCRTHKWWRATTMARIWHSGLHQQGFFSYNYDISVDDREDDNPIEVDSFGDLRSKTHIFLTHCPFRADSCTSEQHNLYSNTVQDHFKDSYLNVILETHLDVDQSGGVFITEKTFKPIKNCQPFIVFGAKGTIQQLKRMGYRTFDHVIDHSYDGIENNTQRWNTAYQEFTRLISSDIHEIYLSCRADLEHNQRLFLSSKAQRLNILLEQSIKYATNRQ